jgi:hypothetical protein
MGSIKQVFYLTTPLTCRANISFKQQPQLGVSCLFYTTRPKAPDFYRVKPRLFEVADIGSNRL